eukprot:6298707-Ditylum_brightwellii.AAC.1
MCQECGKRKCSDNDLIVQPKDRLNSSVFASILGSGSQKGQEEPEGKCNGLIYDKQQQQQPYSKKEKRQRQ